MSEGTPKGFISAPPVRVDSFEAEGILDRRTQEIKHQGRILSHAAGFAFSLLGEMQAAQVGPETVGNVLDRFLPRKMDHYLKNVADARRPLERFRERASTKDWSFFQRNLEREQDKVEGLRILQVILALSPRDRKFGDVAIEVAQLMDRFNSSSGEKKPYGKTKT